MDYARSGVDITLEAHSVAALVGALGPSVRKSGQLGAPLGEVGGFSGLIEFGPDALALCTDGVGSKLLLAEQFGTWDHVGMDCVAMNANDLLCCGAEPLAFVDYLAVPQANEELHAILGRSLYHAVTTAGMTLCGGETATLPGIVNSIDLSGAALGHIPGRQTIEQDLIGPGDVLIGLPASGFHSNGFTLIRAVLESSGTDASQAPPFDASWASRVTGGDFERLADVLLEPTRIYTTPLVGLFERLRSSDEGASWKDLHGLVHITGGGLENILRLGAQCTFVIDAPLSIPPEMEWLAKQGDIDINEMYRVFNMGMGMLLVVSKNVVGNILDELQRDLPAAKVVGYLKEGRAGVKHAHTTFFE